MDAPFDRCHGRPCMVRVSCGRPSCFLGHLTVVDWRPESWTCSPCRRAGRSRSSALCQPCSRVRAGTPSLVLIRRGSGGSTSWRRAGTTRRQRPLRAEPLKSLEQLMLLAGAFQQFDEGCGVDFLTYVEGMSSVAIRVRGPGGSTRGSGRRLSPASRACRGWDCRSASLIVVAVCSVGRLSASSLTGACTGRWSWWRLS